jgi:hypothetical protein
MVARQRVSPGTIGARPTAARRRLGRGSALAAVIVATLVVIGAPSSAWAQTPPGGNSKAFEKYRKCLATHGVELPKTDGFSGGGTPGGGPPSGSLPEGARPGGSVPGGNGGAPTSSLPKGVSQKKFNKAQKACRSKLPKGARGGGPGGGSAEFQAYLSCLRDHGVDVPEPGRNGSNRLPNFDPNDPTFAAANKTCGALAPSATTTTAAPV